MPHVSILMSTYNNAPFLRQAVDSVLAQTVADYELIILDDASTDDTPQILASLQDPRIRIHRNAQNLGLAGSLNVGLDMARGELIARADSDDILQPDWLVGQLAFLAEYPAVGLVSANMIQIDADGTPLHYGKPLYSHAASDAYLRWDFLLKCSIPHNTVVMRRAILEKHHLRYDPAFTAVEDHDLWTRLNQHTQLWRRQQVAVAYRIHGTSASRHQRVRQTTGQLRIVQRQFEALLGEGVSQRALETLYQTVHLPDNQQHDYLGAAHLLIAAYRQTLQRDLSAEDRRHIQGDAVGYLLQLGRRAQAHNPIVARIVMAQMGRISWNEFLSRNMLRRLWNPANRV